MAPETTALLSALTALVGGLAGFLARSRLSDVIASGSVREETAVNKMADLLGQSAGRDEKTIERLLAMLDKSLDTVAKQTGAMQQIALALQGHEQDENLRWAQDRDTSERILNSISDARQAITDLEHLMTDVALNVLADFKHRTEEKNQEAECQQ